MAELPLKDIFDYHSQGRPGKVEVVPTKKLDTQRDLSLAYTPGVARVVEEIERRPAAAFEYTARANLVAVVTNGTAILGLGNRGPLAAKPVMEGKGILFKRFADVDVFDIELDARSTDEMVAAVTAMAPTFGGINLEDIKAPECFEVERRLKERLDIPVFHDDQHGTAIITGAALLNALTLTGKKIESIKIVVSGAGAAAIACAEFYVTMGALRSNIRLVDTKGVVYRGRPDNMNPYKERLAADTEERTLADAVRGADVFLGLSGKDVLLPAMLATMAERPVVFACANPDPRDPLRGSAGDTPRRDRRNRAQRLPEPDQQSPGLPVHLPRRTRCARTRHQRRDEARRRTGAGRARPRGRAGVRARRVRRGLALIRRRLSHPETARPAAPLLGGARRRGGGDEERRRAETVPDR